MDDAAVPSDCDGRGTAPLRDPRSRQHFLAGPRSRFVGHGLVRAEDSAVDAASDAVCERLIGTVRRECLDFMIAVSERHLRRILAEWVDHYNHGSPHASLGPGIPDPTRPNALAECTGHTVRADRRIVVTPILGGLYHEYWLEPVAA